jgi:hypothetical protein
MDDDKFIDWYQDNFNDNAVAFAERKEDEFEEYCLEVYSQLGSDNEDEIYERYRDNKEGL